MQTRTIGNKPAGRLLQEKAVSNEIKNVSKDGRMANYMIFILLDIVESLVIISEKESNKAGLQFKSREKILFNQIKYSVKDLRKTTTTISETSQEDFGDDADDIMKLIMMTIDRAGVNKQKFDLIINFIKSINPEMELNLRKFGITE